MLSIGSQPIFLYQGAVDMRKSFNGLSSLVEVAFPQKLLTGSLFVFVNRRRNLLKVLYWDEDGLALWYKRLEKGTFKLSRSGKLKITRREFSMLLEGVEPRRMNQRFSLNG
jgi:transposase